MKRKELVGHRDQITHLSGDGNYTLVHFLDGSRQMFATTLYLCLEELTEFIRTHRKYAVNPAFVSKVEGTRLSGSVVVEGKSIPVSRRLAKSVFEALSSPGHVHAPKQRTRLSRPLHYHMTNEVWLPLTELTWR